MRSYQKDGKREGRKEGKREGRKERKKGRDREGGKEGGKKEGRKGKTQLTCITVLTKFLFPKAHFDIVTLLTQ